MVSFIADTLVFKDEVLFALPDNSLLPEKGGMCGIGMVEGMHRRSGGGI